MLGQDSNTYTHPSHKLDDYKSLPISLETLVKKDCKDLLPIFEDVAFRVSRISRKTYFSLKSYLLQLFDMIDTTATNELVSNFPIINKDFIHSIQKSILIPNTRGAETEEGKLEDIKMFREDVIPDMKFPLEDGAHLSQVLVYENTAIITNIENNIKLHFEEYVNKFVNTIFNAKRKDKKLWLEISKVKKDLHNNTLLSDPSYHDWINKYRYFIVPRYYEKSHAYYLTYEPQKYLVHMFWMNNEMEKLGKDIKLFNVLPLGNSFIPNYVVIDTKTLIELYYNSKYLNDIEGSKDLLWTSACKIPYYNEKYSFDYSIETNGYAASLRYIHKDKLTEVNIKKAKMSAGRKRTPEQKAEVNRLKLVKKEEDRKKKEIEKNIRIMELEDLEKLKKTNPVLYKTKMLEKKEANKQAAIQKDLIKQSNKEFRYIDEENVYEELKYIVNIVYIDPGKKNLIKLKGISIITGKEVFLTYSNGEHLHNTKRLEYFKKLTKQREKSGILEIEKVLCDYRSNSCTYKTFLLYAIKYFEIYPALEKLYGHKKFRQYKWYSSIVRKRTYDQLNNLIAKTFGSNAILIIGDGSINPCMRNLISTPNKTIKRKLKEKFKVYLIYEFRTSCINYKTEKYNKNMYLPDKTGKSRKLHSVLTYQMENKRMGCINRDKNACYNIEKLYKHYMRYKAGHEKDSRPLVFQRSYKIKE